MSPRNAPGSRDSANSRVIAAISSDLRRRLDAIAKKNNTTVSALVRDALTKAYPKTKKQRTR